MRVEIDAGRHGEQDVEWGRGGDKSPRGQKRDEKMCERDNKRKGATLRLLFLDDITGTGRFGR